MKNELKNKVREFFIQFSHKYFSKGEILIYPGSKPVSVFYLERGYVKQYAITEKGAEIVLNTFKSNTYFPMSNAVNDISNDYYFEAETDIEVWIAPIDKIVEFIQKNPEILYDLLKRVYSGTEGILLRLSYLMSGKAYHRLIVEILIQTKRFGENVFNETYKLNSTESELASLSGLTRETVSREMKNLRLNNLVTIENKHFVIHDLKRLENELVN